MSLGGLDSCYVIRGSLLVHETLLHKPLIFQLLHVIPPNSSSCILTCADTFLAYEQAEPIFKEPTKYTELADPLLEGNFPVKCFNQAVAVAAMCLHGDASMRPLMRDVVTALSYLGLGPHTGSVSPLSDPENNCDEVSATERERAVAEALEWGSTSRHNKARAMASVGSSV